VTAPVGLAAVAATVTATVIGCPGNEGSGLTEVIRVVEDAGAALGS
jgi:hypothetical protein